MGAVLCPGRESTGGQPARQDGGNQPGCVPQERQQAACQLTDAGTTHPSSLCLQPRAPGQFHYPTFFVLGFPKVRWVGSCWAAGWRGGEEGRRHSTGPAPHLAQLMPPLYYPPSVHVPQCATTSLYW